MNDDYYLIMNDSIKNINRFYKYKIQKYNLHPILLYKYSFHIWYFSNFGFLLLKLDFDIQNDLKKIENQKDEVFKV